MCLQRPISNFSKIAENSLDFNKQLCFHKDHPTAQATFNQARVGVKKNIKTEQLFNISILLKAIFSSLRNIGLSYFLVFYAHLGGLYPALSRESETFHWSWAKWIIFRNILGTVFICGFWEWFLYFSPWRHKLFKAQF